MDTLFDLPDPEREYQPVVTGRYFGSTPTTTERESGAAIEIERHGPLKRGRAGHVVLMQYKYGERLTAYEASLGASGDWHAKRRESTRLLERGFLRKDGTKPNQAPSGRPHVDAFVITSAGLDELRRLANEAS